MGVPAPVANAALRLSLGTLSDATTPERTAQSIGALVSKVRAPQPAAAVEAW
jgi:hypothetical protein